VSSTLLHPPSLVARAALLGPVVQAGLQESAADLLSVAALELLAEQARTTGRPELALRRAMEAGSLHAVLTAVAGSDAVDACLAALRVRDLDLLAAHLCVPAPRAVAQPASTTAAA
jgi:hypothetical protein